MLLYTLTHIFIDASVYSLRLYKWPVPMAPCKKTVGHLFLSHVSGILGKYIPDDFIQERKDRGLLQWPGISHIKYIIRGLNPKL